ncbi:MAG TPA: hypothetical protein PKA41_04100 [Verrucomicrobiota bacterium]|nr:hypothetical protein [Verrucomicrobiota bacterium]
MKRIFFTLYLLTLSLSVHAQLQLANTMHFGRGLTLPNPATDRALIVTPEFFFAADQDAPGGREGYVYVFTNHHGNWVFSQKLTDHFLPTNNRGWFGYAIGHGTNSHGEWLAVESTWARSTNKTTQPTTPHGTGDIQMFKLNTTTRQWEFFQYIVPQATDEFGNSPSISGDWMVCGSLGHWYNSDPYYAYSGAGWFYQFDPGSNRWELRQGPVMCSGGSNNWNFAYTATVHGTNALFYGRFNNAHSGALYLYELRDGTWVETGVLRPNSPKPTETFGIAYVQCQEYGEPGIKDDLLVVGAPQRASSFQTGGVYFFQHNGTNWNQIGSHFPTNLQPRTYYGNSGDMKGDLCVIGARFAEWTQTFSPPATTDGKGIVDVFKFDGSKWNLVQTLAPESRQQFDWFGSWTTTDGTNVYVVSPGATVNGAKTNILHKFSPPPTPTPDVLPPNAFLITGIQHSPDGLLVSWTANTNFLYTVEINTNNFASEWIPAPGIDWPQQTNQIFISTPPNESALIRIKATQPE